MLEEHGVDGQFFDFHGLAFDVAKARAIILANPREPIDIPPGRAYEAITGAKIHKSHASHVDIRFPSIVVRHKGKYVFIDGNHRAFKRLCRLLPVKAYLLSPREKRAILDRK